MYRRIWRPVLKFDGNWLIAVIHVGRVLSQRAGFFIAGPYPICEATSIARASSRSA